MTLQNDTVQAYFAWDTDEVIQENLLQRRSLRCCIPAGEFPPRSDILTYKLTTGLG